MVLKSGLLILKRGSEWRGSVGELVEAMEGCSEAGMSLSKHYLGQQGRCSPEDTFLYLENTVKTTHQDTA